MFEKFNKREHTFTKGKKSKRYSSIDNKKIIRNKTIKKIKNEEIINYKPSFMKNEYNKKKDIAYNINLYKSF